MPEAILFAVFTLLSMIGLYLVGKHFSGRRLGFWLAFGGLVFFAALGLVLRWMALTWGG